jgi:hypothetical protein
LLNGLYVGKSVDESRAKAFEKDRTQAVAELQDYDVPLLQTIVQFRMMESSFLSPQEFYLRPKSVGSRELELAFCPEHE